MPPKKSAAVSTAAKSSKQAQRHEVTDDQLQDALEELHAQLERAVKSVSQGQVRSNAKIRGMIFDGVKQRRKDLKKLDTYLITKLMADLEEGGFAFCNRMVPELYSVLLQAILQAEYSREGERGLYLLTGSMYHETSPQKIRSKRYTSPQQQEVRTRKAEIGTLSLTVLMEFFTARNNHDGMRRWVGTLLLQLLQDCDKNANKLELGKEVSRRKLGPLVVQERNEIVRIVCGNLIRSLTESGMNLDHLWPVEAASTQYQNFPPPGSNWNQRFQMYIDEVGQGMSPTTESRVGQVYFCMNVSTSPECKFGTIGHNVTISLERDQMNIWAGSTPDIERFDQSLQIPMESITCMTITTGVIDGMDAADVSFDINSSSACVPYIDCLPNKLTKVAITMRMEDTNAMREELDTLISTMAVTEQPQATQTQEETRSQSNQSSSASQVSNHSQSEEAVILGRDNEAIVDNPSLSQKAPGSQKAVGADMRSTVVEPVGSDASNDEQENHGHLSQRLKEANENNSGYRAPTELQTKLSTSQKPVNPQMTAISNKVGSGVTKLKAKTPLWQSQRFGEAQGKLSAAEKKEPTRSRPEALNTVKPLVSSTSQDTTSCMKILGERFPHTAQPKLLAALTAANGVVDEAVSLLMRGSTSDDLSRFGAHFASDSMTSPEPNNASTPKIHKDIHEKGTIEAVAASVVPKNKSELLTKMLKAAKKKPTDIQNGKQKRYSLKTATPEVNDSYDIPEDEVLSDADSYKPRAKKKISKDSAQGTKGATAISKATGGVKTSTIAENNKTNKAPPVLNQSSQTTRSQRSAAAKASQQMKGIDDSDEEGGNEAEMLEIRQEKLKARHTETKAASKNSQSMVGRHNKPKAVVDKEEEPSKAERVDTQPLNPKHRGTVASDASQKTTGQVEKSKEAAVDDHQGEDAGTIQHDASATALTNNRLHGGFNMDDLYDATPRKPTKKPAKPLPKEQVPKPTGFKESTNSTVAWGSVVENFVEPNDHETRPREQSESRYAPVQIDSINTKISTQLLVKVNAMQTQTIPPIPVRLSQVADGGASNPLRIGEMPPPQQTRTQMRSKKDSPVAHETSPMVFADNSKEDAQDNLNNAVDDVVGSFPSQKQSGGEIQETSVSSDRGKRKADSDIETPLKRQRPKENPNGPTANVTEVHSPPRRSPRIQAQKQAAKVNVGKAGRKPKCKQSPQPTCSSPRLAARGEERVSMLQITPTKTPLVDEHLARKQQIISFGAHGARNQGLLSSRQPHSSDDMQYSSSAKQPSERKRKREIVDKKDNDNPKRQKSVSPENEDNLAMDIDQQFSSPLQLELPLPSQASSQGPRFPRKPALASRRSSGLSRPRSQLSVNSAGSPMGGTPIDHISKVRQKLIEEPTLEPSHEVNRSPSPTIALFGPKINLVGLPKVRPSSPAEAVSNYVFHQKNESGHYEGIDTNEVIAPEKALPDPFVEKITRDSTGFTKRLVAASPQVTAGQEKDTFDQTICQVKPLQEMQNNAVVAVKRTGLIVEGPAKDVPVENQLPQRSAKVELKKNTVLDIRKTELVIKRPAREVLVQNQLPQKSTKTNIQETERALVNLGSEEFVCESPGDMTSAASSSPHSESVKSHTESEKWNLALRPHYSNLSGVIHRIADEVIVRLANEEDVTGLVVDQYKDGGSKLLDHHLQIRNSQKDFMRKEVERKKQELVQIYTDAKEFVDKSNADIHGGPVSTFSKQWKKDQDSVQNKITESRRNFIL